MAGFPLKIPPQINRLILLTLGIVGSYLIARYFLTPATFGQYGWYRGAALEEIASRTPVYAGKLACDECHSEKLEMLAKGKHQTLSCEGCHGVSSQHAANPDILPVKMAGSHCIRCHEQNDSRPTWYKQIVVKDHYAGKCRECHMPHNPTEVPEEPQPADQAAKEEKQKPESPEKKPGAVEKAGKAEKAEVP
ncbi:MAG TPA: hypothetical protein PLU30_06280 [Verrucomicrobiae bacterium]|nr:hypothetical protein [Verrucomicrobiae bacterium]